MKKIEKVLAKQAKMVYNIYRLMCDEAGGGRESTGNGGWSGEFPQSMSDI